MFRSCAKTERDSIPSYDTVYSDEEEKKKWPLWKRILVITGIVILSLIILLLIVAFVILPLVFMNSISIQRYFMFMPMENPKNPQFNHPEKYDLKGIVNFYVTTVDLDNETLTSIGAWLILHEDDINSIYISHNNSTAAEILRATKRPILLYLHGVGCNRILPISTGEFARKHFLVIMVDHRGYGDSGPNVELNELGIVSDTVQFYRWIRNLTSNEIYVWGHSLGTALSTHSVKKLYEDHGVSPAGLVLESAFTTMREEIPENPVGKLFSWLPYFEQTILNPVERNGFLFLTSTNIRSVHCPIMMLAAEDDNIVPYFLTKRLYELTIEYKNESSSVLYHQFPAVGYKHVGITTDKKLPQYLEEFLDLCRQQNKMIG